MPSFNHLPLEIVYHIVDSIDQPKTFYRFSQVSKTIAQVSKILVPKKMIEFSREMRYLSKDKRHYYEYMILPNGKKIGEHKVWLIDNDLNLNAIDNRILISHYFINETGSEVKAFWATGFINVYQEWYHNPVNKIMTEHKIFKQSGELDVCRYNMPFIKSMFRNNIIT